MRHDPYRTYNGVSYNFMYYIANCVYVMQSVIATVYGKTFEGDTFTVREENGYS